MDYFALSAAIVLGLGILCATTVYIFALLRADQMDIVSVVRALPDLVLAPLPGAAREWA
ncbi:hypothetical protein [Streptomyces sp. NPDC048438]|uniref:hypothetical protein n=1 Tax=Streptomyces sp. NPDC048438 TaxID=3365551 RepID=UPI00371EED28